MNIAAVLIAALFGGGVWAFLGTLLKYRPTTGEQATTIVQLADKAVVVQSSVIDDLNDQLSALRKTVATQTGRIESLEAEVHELNRHLTTVRVERDQARRELERLRLDFGTA